MHDMSPAQWTVKQQTMHNAGSLNQINCNKLMGERYRMSDGPGREGVKNSLPGVASVSKKDDGIFPVLMD